MKKTAEISECGNYRYYLTREWDESLPLVNFICLNPSVADAEIDDPTLRRCMNYAEIWGYGGIIMTNLFAYRATEPMTMLTYKGDVVGPETNQYLLKGAKEAALCVAGWGNHGMHMDRGSEVIEMLPKLHFLAKTKEGHLRHPLYLTKDLKPKIIVKLNDCS